MIIVTESSGITPRELLESARKYTVFGDVHTWTGTRDLLLSMMEQGCFSSLYLEALKRGDYRQEGDKLKDRRHAYGMNPEKYDELIDRSLRCGIDVHGINVTNRRANGRPTREETDCVTSWAEYIVQTANGRNLIVVGTYHIDRWNEQPECGDLQDALLRKNVQERDILRIVPLNPKLPGSKLYNRNFARRTRMGRFSDLPKEQKKIRKTERLRPAHYFWEAY